MMPLDPSIPLGVRPPQINSPAQAMEQAYTLRNLQAQAELAPQERASLIQERDVQTQERSLQVAKAQREQAEVEATAAAVKGSMEPDPVTGVLHPNYEKAAGALADQGFGERAAGLLDTANKLATSRGALREQMGKIQAASLEHRGELALSAIRGLQSGADPEHVRGMLIDHAAVGAGDGVMTEQDARDLLAQARNTAPDHLAASLDQFLTPAIRTREADIREKTAKASLEEMKAKPPNMQAYQNQIDALVPASDMSNSGLRRAAIARVQNARTVEDADKAVEDLSRNVGQIQVAKATVPYKIEVQTGGMNYAPNPQTGDVNPAVKAIAEYRVPPLSGFAMARPAGQALMSAVTAYNPAYDATKYEQRQKVRTAYTTGTEGQQLNALNTAIMHMDLLADAADALKNGNFKPGNQAYNAIRDAFGATPPSSYDGIKEFLDGEVGAVVKKGVATEGEMGRLAGKAGSTASPDQIRQYIKNAMNILGGKAAVLDDKYHSVMGPTDPFAAISSRSQEVLIKHGFNPANFGGNAPTIKSSGPPDLVYDPATKTFKKAGS